MGGLGLGLTLVKGLVELHGGEVTAYSEGPGKGSRFTVRIPVLARDQVGPHAAAAEVERGRRRVLVVEDNKDAADTLAEALSLSGYQVEVTYDGRSGLAKAREFRPEAVICDIGLPDIDGYAVVAALRLEPPTSSARLIALTGYAQPEDVRRAREAGFHAHLPKPPDLAALEHLLAQD
jgi:CheY-like chemotaxis protein